MHCYSPSCLRFVRPLATMSMDIPPDLVEKQKFFQTAQGLVHRKAKGDRITSVLIPAGLTLAAAVAMVRSTRANKYQP